jgi:hypothetical protein
MQPETLAYLARVHEALGSLAIKVRAMDDAHESAVATFLTGAWHMNHALTRFLKAAYAISKQIVPQIAVVEAIFTGVKEGSNKKNAVLEGIMLAPEIVELVRDKELVDEVMFREGVGDVNDGYVKILNAFKPAAHPAP